MRSGRTAETAELRQDTRPEQFISPQRASLRAHRHCVTAARTWQKTHRRAFSDIFPGLIRDRIGHDQPEQACQPAGPDTRPACPPTLGPPRASSIIHRSAKADRQASATSRPIASIVFVLRSTAITTVCRSRPLGLLATIGSTCRLLGRSTRTRNVPSGPTLTGSP